MLPEDPMRSGQATSTATQAKIIPLRRPEGRGEGRAGAGKYDPRESLLSRGRFSSPFGPARGSSPARPTARGSRDDAVRHYLKFMLPGIPVTAFVISFLYGYLLVGMHTLVLNGHATEQSYTPAVDPTLPLIGALLVAFATGMLCVTIYWGYLRISERHEA